MQRRVFLRTLLLTLAALPCGGHALAGGAMTAKSPPRASSSRTMMGTDVTILSFHESEDFTHEIHAAMFELADALTSIFSRHDDLSALSYLNATRRWRQAPPELLTVLLQAEHYHHQTAGAFDIRVLPLLTLLEHDPAPEQLEHLLRQVDLSGQYDIVTSNDTVAYGGSATAVTLDGIAKGYIVDRMLDLAKQRGLKHCLVNAGGDIGCFGGCPGHAPWEISLYNPVLRKLDDRPLRLYNGAVATSGLYFKPLGNHDFHHIIDPRDNMSPHHHASVTITATDVVAADAMATACMILDTDSARITAITHGMQAICINQAGEIS